MADKTIFIPVGMGRADLTRDARTHEARASERTGSPAQLALRPIGVGLPPPPAAHTLRILSYHRRPALRRKMLLHDLVCRFGRLSRFGCYSMSPRSSVTLRVCLIRGHAFRTLMADRRSRTLRLDSWHGQPRSEATARIRPTGNDDLFIDEECGCPGPSSFR